MRRWKNTLISKDVDKAKLFRNSGAYVVLFLAVGAMTFFGVCEPTGNRILGPAGNAAVVGDVEVSSMEFRREYQRMMDTYRQQYRDAFDPAAMRLSERVMDTMVNRMVTYSEAERSGLHVTDDEIVKLIADAEVFKNDKGGFDGERFDRYLKYNGYTEKSFTEEQRRNLLTNKFRRFVNDTFYLSKKDAEWRYRLQETKYQVDYLKFQEKDLKVVVSKDEVDAFLAGEGAAKVKDYYDRNKASEFEKKAKVKARHILTAFKGARGAEGEAAERSKEDARKKAEALLAQVKKGADFAKTASAETDDPSGKSNGGDLGFFEAQAMVKEFSDVAFKLNKGQISGIVESPFGFHIIKVEDKQDAVSISFDQAQREIAKNLLEKERRPEIMAEMTKGIIDAINSGDHGTAAKLAANQGITWNSSNSFAADARAIPGIAGSTKIKEAVLALKKPGEVHPEVLDASGAKYIVKLKSLSKADGSGFNDVKAEEIQKGSRFMEAYTLYNSIIQRAEQEYQDKGQIWVSEEFRQYSVRQQQQQGG